MGRKSREKPGPASTVVPQDVALALFPRRQVVLVAGVALLFRALYYWLYRDSPFFHVPVVDASTFHLWAEAIRQHREFAPGVYFKPPLYPYVLAAVYDVWGPRPEPMYLLQNLLGAGTCVMVLGLGRRLFSPAVGLIGAVICALLPVLPFLEFQLVGEPLTTFLTVAALLILVARKALPARAGVAGLLLGIAALGRPNLLILAPVLAWWVWRQPGRARGPAIALLVATGVGIAPATLHNLQAGGLIPVSANGGANLWTGIRPGADGVSAIPIGIQWDDLQLQAERAGARDVAAADAWLTRRSFAAMIADPLRALGLTARRALLLVNAHEGRNNIGAVFLARTQGVVVLRRWWPGFWLVAPLALLGLFAIWRPQAFGAVRPGTQVNALLLMLGALAVAILPFFVNARFRQPMLPIMALLAAHGLLAAAAAIRGRGRPALVAGSVLLGAIILVNVDWFDLRRPAADAIDELNLATILARGYEGHPPDLGAAFTHLGTAARLDPDDPDVPERWGLYLQSAAIEQYTMAERTGQMTAGAAAATRRNLEQALSLHRSAITMFPRSFRSYSSAGNAHVMLGRLAGKDVATALAAGDTATARTQSLDAARQLESGLLACQAALQLQPNLPGVRENIGACRQLLRSLPNLDPAINAAKQRLGV